MAKRQRRGEQETEQETARSEEPEPDAAEAATAEAAMLGDVSAVQRAALAFRLEPEHVAASKVNELEDGTVEVVIVTNGGQKLRWPADVGRVLAQHEKDGSVPGSAPAGFAKHLGGKKP